jgi:hypothetical protein
MILDLDENGSVVKADGQYAGGVCSFISWTRLSALLASTGQGGTKPHEYISQLKIDQSGITFTIKDRVCSSF